tara:strand:- start:12001 stop:12375 length:375 start_codon:yes stop_codon:yes gene_type:complete
MYLKTFENFDENLEYPYFLGKESNEYKSKIEDDKILYVTVYKTEMKPFIRNGKDSEALDIKMNIDKKDLSFKRTSNGTEVWSKVDPGDHYKNETSVIVTSGKDDFFKGGNYRGMILREEPKKKI